MEGWVKKTREAWEALGGSCPTAAFTVEKLFTKGSVPTQLQPSVNKSTVKYFQDLFPYLNARGRQSVHPDSKREEIKLELVYLLNMLYRLPMEEGRPSPAQNLDSDVTKPYDVMILVLRKILQDTDTAPSAKSAPPLQCSDDDITEHMGYLNLSAGIYALTKIKDTSSGAAIHSNSRKRTALDPADDNIVSSTAGILPAPPLPPPHPCITTYHDDDVSAISMSSEIMGNSGDYNIMSSTPDVPLATPLPPPHSCITTYHDDDVSAISMSSDLITDFSSNRSVVSTLQETVQKLPSGLTPEYSEILGGEPGEYCYVVKVRDLVRSFEGTSPTPLSKKSQSVEEAYAKLLPDLQEFLSDVYDCHALSTPPTRSASVTVKELLDRFPSSLFKVDKPKPLTEEVNKLFTTTISLQITFELYAQGEKAMNKKAAKASAAESFMSKYRGYI
jgi:hypothetical protein